MKRSKVVAEITKNVMRQLKASPGTLKQLAALQREIGVDVVMSVIKLRHLGEETKNQKIAGGISECMSYLQKAMLYSDNVIQAIKDGDAMRAFSQADDMKSAVQNASPAFRLGNVTAAEWKSESPTFVPRLKAITQELLDMSVKLYRMKVMLNNLRTGPSRMTRVSW